MLANFLGELVGMASLWNFILQVNASQPACMLSVRISLPWTLARGIRNTLTVGKNCIGNTRSENVDCEMQLSNLFNL